MSTVQSERRIWTAALIWAVVLVCAPPVLYVVVRIGGMKEFDAQFLAAILGLFFAWPMGVVLLAGDMLRRSIRRSNATSHGRRD